MKRLRKGDQVVLLSGRDKGRKGTILQVRADGSVVVEGLNVVKKWSAGSSKASRIGFRTLADGKKVRYFKSNDEQLDV
jgi:large subunit ribosomal protein L24